MEIKIYPILSFFNIAYFENVFLNQCIHPFLVNGQNVCEVVLYGIYSGRMLSYALRSIRI